HHRAGNKPDSRGRHAPAADRARETGVQRLRHLNVGQPSRLPLRRNLRRSIVPGRESDPVTRLPAMSFIEGPSRSPRDRLCNTISDWTCPAARLQTALSSSFAPGTLKRELQPTRIWVSVGVQPLGRTALPAK